MKQILIVKTGSISKEDKRELLHSDVIVIEHEHPEQVRVISKLDGLKIDGATQTMIDVILKTPYSAVRDEFSKCFLKALSSNQTE